MNRLKKRISPLLLFLVFTCYSGYAQNMLPGRGDLINHKVSEVIVTDNAILNKISRKKYVDTLKYSIYAMLTGKRITAYDTDSKRQFAGTWKYTYDSLGNRLLETRAYPEQNLMDYYNYVYDSNRIKKQIWIYWLNMKHIFDRIYEVKYDGYGRLITELIEDGGENIDTVISFKYDSLNRLYKILTTRDKDLKEQISLVTYFYNPDGTVSKTLTNSKNSPSEAVEEFTYDTNKKLVKKTNDTETTTYLYDKNGLLTESDVMLKNKKGLKLKYTYSYIYRQ